MQEEREGGRMKKKGREGDTEQVMSHRLNVETDLEISNFSTQKKAQ